tara:strand:- start:671 stop:904 length:234 start_codon:yes stop_codon:yes gene_type:complete
MTKDEMSGLIQAFIDDGGEVTRLREASQRDIDKAQRTQFHKDKAIAGSERSKNILERQDEKEQSFIFSRDERWAPVK